MGRLQIIQIVIRGLLISLNGIILFYSYIHSYVISFSVFLLLTSFQLFLLTDYIKKLFNEVEKSIDCLLYNDYSNTISDRKRKNTLHKKTALLLEKHRKENIKKASETLIFTNILESLNNGILILKKDQQNTITVFQINKSFCNFFKIPKYYKWSLLQKKIGDLTKHVEKWESVRHIITIKLNEKKEQFFLKTSTTQTNEYGYLVISLETIQQLIDQKEKEAWFKLMNVMSHEIINTITPISSLAENLESLLHEENNNDENTSELSEGLKIIKKRSYHLTSFIDTYRKLAELPLPNKKELNLINLIKDTLSLFKQEFLSKKIKVSFNSFLATNIYADKQQIEQVLVNLLSNSIYALSNIKNKEITIDILEESNRIYLTISDNGNGITKKIKDKIFVPYFTTRKEGKGIGLTLSKSIIEAHNGTIHFTSKKEKTSFIITFVK